MAEIIGKNTIKLESVDSTNNYTSKLLADNKLNEGTVVLAGYQNAGRGQINNSWESEPGKNLLMSVLLYPDFLPVQHQFLLSKVVALGVRDLLACFVDEVKIKWPNDIYVGDKKIAGILIENSIMGYTIGSAIAGIGVNINQKSFLSNAPNPVSLFQLTGGFFNLDELFGMLCETIELWYGLLRSNKVDIVNEAYINALYRLGVESFYSDNDGEYLGVITGVNSIGQLLIRASNGKNKNYHFKEVAFL
ncbi:MAG: biotin--[acetyl-CoA-carboxylase] ligase [Prolixibacteraceae bacterium]|nr:biotin--[acetyl-CoA-carboxylase] ligase [Prolixibacteraceae bacterium]